MGSLVLSCPLCCRQKLSSVEALREHLLYFVYRPIPCPVCQAPITGLQQLVHHLDIHVEGLQFGSPSSSSSGNSLNPMAPLVKDISVVAPDSNLLSVQDMLVTRTAPKTQDSEVKKFSIVDSLIHSEKNTLVQLDLLSIQKELSASGGAETRSSCVKSCKNKSEFVSDVQNDISEGITQNHSIQFDWHSLHVPCSVSSESTLNSIERSFIASGCDKSEASMVSNSKLDQQECYNDVELTEDPSTNSGWNSGTNLVMDNTSHAVSPSFVANPADVTVEAAETHQQLIAHHSPLARSPCSEELPRRRLRSSPSNIFTRHVLNHQRPSMQAYVCPTCGAKIVGQDSYFCHLQEHTDEVPKSSERNDGCDELDIDAPSPAERHIPSLADNDIELFCPNDDHLAPSFPSSFVSCEEQVNEFDSGLSPKRVYGMSTSPELVAEASEVQHIETTQCQSNSCPEQSVVFLNQVDGAVITIDDGPQTSPESCSRDFAKSFSKPPNRASHSLIQESYVEVVYDDGNPSEVCSSVEELPDSDDPSLNENVGFSSEKGALCTSVERKLPCNKKILKTSKEPSLCTNLKYHSTTFSCGLEKNEITKKMREPYLHKKFHHEQKSTVVGNSRGDEVRSDEDDAEESGCYIPDIQSVWVSRLNASLARDEPRTTEHLRQPQEQTVIASTKDIPKESSDIIAPGISKTDHHCGDVHCSSSEPSCESDLVASMSAQLYATGLESEEMQKGSCVKETSLSQNMTAFESNSTICNVSYDELVQQSSDPSGKIVESLTAGNDKDVNICSNASYEKANVHQLKLSADSSSFLPDDNRVACVISSNKNNCDSKAKFINSFPEDGDLGKKISSAVSHKEGCLPLPSPPIVVNREISQSVEVGGAVLDEPPSMDTGVLRGTSASLPPACREPSSLPPACREPSSSVQCLNFTRNSEEPSSCLELQDYSCIVNENVKSLESHQEAGVASSWSHGTPNAGEPSMNEDTDSIFGLWRSTAAVIDGVQKDRRVSEDAVPQNPSASGIVVNSTNAVRATEDLGDHSGNIRENRPKLHECRECSKTFLNVSNYRRHLREVHNPTREYLCSVCSKSFCSLRQLINHKGVHEAQKKFQCNLCGHHCYTAAGIRSHKFQEHKTHEILSKPFKCNQCGESFARNFGLRRHIHRRHGAKLFPCSHCEKIYSCFENLQSHSVLHSDQNGNVPLACSFCGSQYKSRFALKRHIAIRHSSPASNGSKLSSCNTKSSSESDHRSRKSVENSGELVNSSNEFLDMHNQSLREKVSVSSGSSFSNGFSMPCPKVFTAGNVLESNEKMNSQEQRTSANGSSDSATHGSLLIRTSSGIHTDFSRSKEKSSPMTSSGVRIPESSSNCGLSFNSGDKCHNSANTEADKTGRFRCPVCSHSFTRKDTLKVHLRSHSSDRPFECDTCGMTFKRRSVLLTHQDKHASVSKYLCSLCDKRFRFKISLKHHSCVTRPHENGDT